MYTDKAFYHSSEGLDDPFLILSWPAGLKLPSFVCLVRCCVPFMRAVDLCLLHVFGSCTKSECNWAPLALWKPPMIIFLCVTLGHSTFLVLFGVLPGRSWTYFIFTKADCSNLNHKKIIDPKDLLSEKWFLISYYFSSVAWTSLFTLIASGGTQRGIMSCHMPEGR